MDQLGRYVDQLRAAEPGARVEGMAVGSSIDPTVATAAAARGMHVRVLDEDALRTIAEQHDVPIDHAAGHRPKLAGTNRSSSVVRQRRGPRPGTGANVGAFVRALDARFAPGSLDGSALLPPSRSTGGWHAQQRRHRIRSWLRSCRGPFSPPSRGPRSLLAHRASPIRTRRFAPARRERMLTDEFASVDGCVG